MNANRAYYLRRALQEQEAVRNAACSEARKRHEELAAAYLLRLRADPVELAQLGFERFTEVA